MLESADAGVQIPSRLWFKGSHWKHVAAVQRTGQESSAGHYSLLCYNQGKPFHLDGASVTTMDEEEYFIRVAKDCSIFAFVRMPRET